MSSSSIRPSESVIAASVPLGESVSRSPFLGESFKQVRGDAAVYVTVRNKFQYIFLRILKLTQPLLFAKDWGFGRDFLGGDGSLRHSILDKDDIVENVAATPLDKIAPTIDLLLSSDSLQNNKK